MLLETLPQVAETMHRAARPRQRTRLLCFVPELGCGGAEMHLLRLLNQFDLSRFDLTLAVVRGGGSYESRLSKDVAVRECGWRHLPSSTLRMQTAISGLRRVFKQVRPQVILTFLDHAVAASAKALSGAPAERPIFIAGIQNNFAKTLQHLPRWARGYLRRNILAGYAATDHVIALSAGVADTLIEAMPAMSGRVSVIHNAGYDPEIEALAVEEPLLPIPKTPWLLGCGRFTEQKDFTTMLRAFARIKDDCNGELWILGEGKLRAKLEHEIDTLGLKGRVRLPGFIRNPFAFMARATAFVLSSRWEGFGNVLTEAMACGTPVFSTDCPHGPREILEGGKWGTLVPVGDIDALSGAMRSALSGLGAPRERAVAAREHVKRFETGRITRQYETLIETTLERRSPR